MLSIKFGFSKPGNVAIQNIEKATKKRVIDVNDLVNKVSPELKIKKDYMQTDEFLKDPHNIKMMRHYDDMLKFRDEIAKNITSNNSNPNNQTQVQGINGFARIKKFLDKNFKMNFSNTTTFNDRANNDYKFALIRIYNLSREFKSKIGR